MDLIKVAMVEVLEILEVLEKLERMEVLGKLERLERMEMELPTPEVLRIVVDPAGVEKQVHVQEGPAHVQERAGVQVEEEKEINKVVNNLKILFELNFGCSFRLAKAP